MDWYKILLIAIASTIGLYIAFLFLLIFEFPQRQYPPFLNPLIHKYFVPSQGTGSFIHFEDVESLKATIMSRSDGERIFAWHILPLEKETSGEHLRILQEDKSARVIIYFHGTTSHVAQKLRLDTYRLLLASNPNTHLLAFDYRGWGYSSGTPSEDGVILDGLTALKWALDTARVDPSRVLLVAQSLGTGIAMGVATEYHKHNPERPLAGIVTIASFTSLRRLVLGYRMGGYLPLLGPLNLIPKAGDIFVHKFLRASFNSAERMERLARTRKFAITLVHATNDWEISYLHSRELFRIACGGDTQVVETVKTNQVTREFDGGRIRLIETLWGGHNDVQIGDAVINAVISAWRYQRSVA